MKKILKEKIIKIIDENRELIINIGTNIYNNPELGYKEHKTTKLLYNQFRELGIDVEKNIAVTGCRAYLNKDKQGPRIAIMGELDSVICFDHKDADKETGAVHACGHNIQAAVMFGVAMAFKKAGICDELGGKIDFIAVPSEEYIEMDFRHKLKKENKITYFGGKQELIYKGMLDNVDISMMMHSLSLDLEKEVIIAQPSGTGFIGKNINFIGKESHAGGAPEEGINALNMASIAINSMHIQRETFRDEDRVRVHQIISKGGDIVNVVPSDVRLETCVRANNIDAMIDANEKVNRCAIGAAHIVGGKVEISDLPGYLPLYNDETLTELFMENAKEFVDENKIIKSREFTGSFDMGDVSHLMPVLHPFIGGIQGGLHSREYEITDKEIAYIFPVKLLAMTIIDLLFDEGKLANKVKNDYEAKMTKEEYLKFLKDIECKKTY